LQLVQMPVIILRFEYFEKLFITSVFK